MVVDSDDKHSVCVDFDGTLAAFPIDFPKLEPPIPGAVDLYNLCRDQGRTFYVMSARPRSHDKLVREWLLDHGFKLAIFVTEKPVAGIYIDDRGYRFKGTWDGLTLSVITRLLDRHDGSA